MAFKKSLLGKFRTVVQAIKSFTWRKLIPTPALLRVKRRSPETLTVYPSHADEICLPGRDWDVLGEVEDERYASLADLCTHVGEQLPTQVVKLIARDVLRELEHLHDARGVVHSDINTHNIILSSRDMRALITQISAESPTSLRPSCSSLDFFVDVNSMLTSTSLPVFRLSSIDMGLKFASSPSTCLT